MNDNKQIEYIEILKSKIVEQYKTIGDMNALFYNGEMYTGNQIVAEFENNTNLSETLLTSAIQLTIDLIARGKEELPNMTQEEL